MENKIDISIVVPVYQVEQYISRCINSILQQTYPFYELILVNDGTKDSSITIADNILKNTSINYVILSKPNGGLSSARNYGLQHAKGDYVVFVDSDDELEKTYLQDLLEACKKNDASISIGKYTEICNGKVKAVQDKCDSTYNYRLVNSNELCHLFFYREVEAHPCTVMYKRSFLMNNNLVFNEEVMFSEDQEFYWRAFPLVETAAIIDKEVYKYYVNMGSITTDPKIEKILSGYEHLCTVSKNGQSFNIISNDIVLRWVLGTLHGTAKFCSLKFYLSMHKKMNYCNHYRKHNNVFNAKIEIAMKITYLFPRLSYFIFKL